MKGETHIHVGAAYGIIWKPTHTIATPVMFDVGNPWLPRLRSSELQVLTIGKSADGGMPRNRRTYFSLS